MQQLLEKLSQEDDKKESTSHLPNPAD